MAFIKYTAVRLGITAAVFLICFQLGLGWIYSAVVAVVVAFCVSFLFLTKMRNAAASSLEYRFSGKAAPLRTATERDDAAAEDAYTGDRKAADLHATSAGTGRDSDSLDGPGRESDPRDNAGRDNARRDNAGWDKADPDSDSRDDDGRDVPGRG